MGPSSVSSSVFPVPDQHHKRYIVRHQQRRNPECRYPIRGPHGSRSSVLIGDAVRFFPQHFACSRRETSTTYPVLLRLFARALMCSLYIGTSGPAPVVIRRLHSLRNLPTSHCRTIASGTGPKLDSRGSSSNRKESGKRSDSPGPETVPVMELRRLGSEFECSESRTNYYSFTTVASLPKGNRSLERTSSPSADD